ncbi:DUF3310 domain-containing protein [Streptomyces sp. CA-288835]|uniref:DUF3310 domain-containing protein n=1 Tax=Streptomyces sp. CA-288835 TaxID=3240069 RepID=UPI003D8D4168
MKLKIGDKVRIATGEHSGHRGQIASISERSSAPRPYYVKVYTSIVRYVWYAEDELRPDLDARNPLGKTDSVNHPSHYTWLPNGLEVIDLTEHLNFNRGNAVKYLARAGHKNPATELEDLKKARWYVDREIQRIEKGQSK